MVDGERLRTFVAEDLWLLIAIVTFGLISLAGMAGLGGLAGALSIVGWFVLTPIFLFWGEEIAAIAFEDEEPTTTRTTGPSEDGEDALDELKRRYAAGEISDEEFEHRLERLIALEDLPPELLGSGSRGGSPTGKSTEPRSKEPERER